MGTGGWEIGVISLSVSPSVKLIVLIMKIIVCIADHNYVRLQLTDF